jgi:hypothetical protein
MSVPITSSDPNVWWIWAVAATMVAVYVASVWNDG